MCAERATIPDYKSAESVKQRADDAAQKLTDFENAHLRNRYATRGAPGPKFRCGTPRRAKPLCRPYSIAEFKAIVERANATGSPPQHDGPHTSVAIDGGSRTNRPFIQVTRSGPEPIPRGRSPPQADEVCAYDRRTGRRP